MSEDDKGAFQPYRRHKDGSRGWNVNGWRKRLAGRRVFNGLIELACQPPFGIELS